MANINRTDDMFKDDSAHGRVRPTGIFIGIVKGNADPQRMGRLAVYIPELGGDPTEGADDPKTWFTVGYASPFAGATNLDSNAESGSSKDEMTGTQKSYGWWGVPPDINNQVLVCFVNGDTARGYWFGCLYQQFMNHMVPALGINRSTKPDINEKNLPPVCEYNRKDPGQNVWDPTRPVFEPLHNGFVAQGLYTDPERGPATTGARRESPSKVVGFISPRGNSIHIDDLEENEFIRMRTRSGVQILIHETTGYIYFISKQGNSWMEISDEGIDMYTKRSINMRAEENINMHADHSIIRHGAGGLHSRGGNHTSASESNSASEVKNNSSHNAGGSHSTDASGGINRNGPQIKDAGGPKPLQSFDVNGANSATTANGVTTGGGTGGTSFSTSPTGIPQNGGSQNGSTSADTGSGSGSSGGGSGGTGSGSNTSQASGNNMNVRSTYYYAGETNSDPDTDAGRTSTGVPVRFATADTVGVAAVDPKVIPYGSQITVQTNDGPRYYIAADTGGAVKSMTASGGTVPVVDFYSKSQVGGTYTDVTVNPYNGPNFRTALSNSQRESFFDINKFKR
jgi:3D (Asp-Asp-Asp) domain-containing protein